MLNRQAIQRVQSLYSKGVQSDNTRLSNRHIYYTLVTIRSTFLSQEQKKGQRISDAAYQTLYCVELVEVPLNQCGCAEDAGCTAMRSKYRIPKTLVGASKHLFTVSGLDGTLKFDETTFEDKKYKKGNKYSVYKPDFFLRDGYIWLTVTKKITTVTITGLFEDPIAAVQFPSCAPFDPCKSYLDYEFPFEEDLFQGLLDVGKIELLQQFGQMKEDKSNDSKDD